MGVLTSPSAWTLPGAEPTIRTGALGVPEKGEGTYRGFNFPTQQTQKS